MIIPTDELEAAEVALTQKPRGRQARALYRYVSRLFAEHADLEMVPGNDARKRQVAIGEELDRLKLPTTNTIEEWHNAMTVGHGICLEARYEPHETAVNEAAIAYEEGWFDPVEQKANPPLDDEIPF